MPGASRSILRRVTGITIEDELLSAVSADGAVNVRVLVASELVREAARRHGTAPTASAALGRSLMGAALLASGKDSAETVQLQFRGDGVLGPVTAIADGSGCVRGYVHDPSAHPPPRDGKLDVGRAVGQGVLAVVRYHPSWREPYSGVVPLVSGEIAEDIAHYLEASEQTAAALALGVFVAAPGDVAVAGGYLVEALPGAHEHSLAHLARTVRSLPSPTELLRQGLGARELLERLFDGLGRGELHRSQPRFFCACSRDRILRAVVLLGREEARVIAHGDEELEVRCEFCATSYRLAPDELGALLPDG